MQYIISYFLFVPVLLIKASFFALYDTILKQELIVTHIFLVTLTESPAFRRKKNTGLYQANEEPKVEPLTLYTLNVFPTQMLFQLNDRLWFKHFKGKRKSQRTYKNNPPFWYHLLTFTLRQKITSAKYTRTIWDVDGIIRLTA